MSNSPSEAPPLTVGSCVTLACVWEATAAKPGNVYRGADFDDLTYPDFLTSAAIVGPILEQVSDHGVGATVLRAVKATRLATGTNTNLGVLLLLSPLAACGPKLTRLDLADVLARLTVNDTHSVYEAIQWAQPGGLGNVDEADVHAAAPADLELVQAMRLAADHDLIARQYTNRFEQVFLIASRLGFELSEGIPVNDAIVAVFLRQLSEHPDSLIGRKCGADVARQVSERATAVLATADRARYHAAVADLDFYLRADGHRRNPGTTADLVAAGLYVALFASQLDWPIKFYS